MIRIGLTALLLAATAGPAAAQESARRGGELVFVVPAEPPSYDAHREETFAIVHPAAPHYNTLLRVDPFDRGGTRIVGDLAESWSASKDGRTYRFALRRGVRFHDGTELTARCMLHETDHCDGIVFLDKMTPLKREIVKRRIKKLQKAGEWPS